eukprot:TRINITY_DN109868_c0_g1_i1.p1 TRINITY_DN109868_c0_g1~~TRINITY_DN109868_c0_g1_i1.p1  ORF type:complete len:695 (+),score=173.21 TRINITY_DN109868_c0_g1_i1:33-2087(+)
MATFGWEEKDLSKWARVSLADFLMAALKDPADPARVLVRTPWAGLEVHLSQVEVAGEANLCGRRGQGFLQFDLDIGARLDILRPGRSFSQQQAWRAVLRLLRFEPGSQPELQVQFDDPHASVADEVSWFLKEGAAGRLLQDALARWHASALQTWIPQESSASPKDGSGTKNMLSGWRVLLASQKRQADVALQRPAEERGSSASMPSMPATQQKEQKSKDSSDALLPRLRVTGYPWLPSALAGVGGPAQTCLMPEAVPPWAGGSTILQRDTEFSDPGADVARKRARQLHDAIRRGDIARAFMLLDAESVDAAVGDEGLSAAHAAVLEGSADMLRLIIEAQADVGKKDLLGRSPLVMSLKKGSTEICKLLLENGAYEAAEVQLKGRSLREAMDQCLDFRASPELLTLIDAKERPRIQGRALLKAISQRDARTAEAALEAGASVSLADDRGDVALLALARGKWPSGQGEESSVLRLATRLCKAGADVNVCNGRGETALLFAAHRGDLALVETLLVLKADPSIANEEGSTALMYAAAAGQEQVCVTLLEAYAPPAAVNNYGLTAEQMATKRGFRSLGVLIAAHAMCPKRQEDNETSTQPAPKKAPHPTMKGSADTTTEDLMHAMRPPMFGIARPDNVARQPTHDFDYGKWDRIVEDIERQEELDDRRQSLEQHPEYVWKNGVKMRVML